MPRLTNTPVITLFSISLTVGSIYFDYGNEAWVWFQRSGSIMVLCGAILGYRSVFRLGLQGVGGAEPHFFKGTITGTHSDGTVDFTYDAKTRRVLREAFRDKFAGFVGAFLIVLGTIIWGYGDLAGHVLQTIHS